MADEGCGEAEKRLALGFKPMPDVRLFSCDFGGGVSCTIRADMDKLRKKAQDFQVHEWTGKPTRETFSAYCRWIHTVNCQLADAVPGKFLYALKLLDGTFEMWLYEPRGKHKKLPAPSRSIESITKDPHLNVEVSDDKEAALILEHLGLLERFTQHGNFPGTGLQILGWDSHPTHLVLAMFFHGFMDRKDNGFHVTLFPKSAAPGTLCAKPIETLKAQNEAKGIRVVVV